MAKWTAIIHMEVDVEVMGAEYEAPPEDIAKQNERCASERWLDDIREALLDMDDSPGLTWTVERDNA